MKMGSNNSPGQTFSHYISKDQVTPSLKLKVCPDDSINGKVISSPKPIGLMLIPLWSVKLTIYV